MEKNKAFKLAIAQLERRCHGLTTELHEAAEKYEGAELLNSIDEIGAKYGLIDFC